MSSKIILTCRRSWRKSIRFYSSTAEFVEPSPDEPKKQMLPFMQNILLGKFDKRVLVYPEILSNERLKNLEYKYLALESREDKIDLQAIGELSVPTESQLGNEEVAVSLSESLRIAEAVHSPSLSVTLDISQNIIPHIISKYGTKEQIDKYVKKLQRGTLIGAYAFTEEVTGSDLPSLNSLATKSNDSWSIKGKKLWVTNGDKADVLLVVARPILEVDAPKRHVLGAFLIDREEGYKVEEVKEIAQDLRVANIVMDQIPCSLIGKFSDGYIIGREFLSAYKYYLAGCCSHLIKKFVSEAVNFVRPRKQLTGLLCERELIMFRLGTAASTAYALDSMLYLMAGLHDGYGVDTETEAGLIHAFIIDHGVAALDACLSIMGSLGVDSQGELRSIRDEFWTVVRSIFSPDIARQYAVLCTLEYTANILQDDINKMRRSLNFPVFFLKKIIKIFRQGQDNPKLSLNLYEELHPSLRNAAEELEYCVLRCNFAVETLLERHGSDVVNRQLDLDRLTSIMMDLLAMTACLGRASRAYCTGIIFCDEEITACTSFCRSAILRSRKNIQEIIDGAIMSNDMPRVELGQHIVNRGGYFLEHPLSRNIE